MQTPPSSSAAPLLRLSEQDNVAVAVRQIDAGQILDFAGRQLVIRDLIPTGHKVALETIPQGSHVLKWGCPIGSASQDIEAGQLVHTHNLQSNYLPTFTMESNPTEER